MVWIFFLSTNQELFSTESTMSIYPRTGTAWIILQSLPNRILWNFLHKPHFHNAISHSVRNFKTRSVPMVWIFFISSNRNYFPTESTIGIYSRTGTAMDNSFHLFQIESSGTFRTRHISTMLYHIVSDSVQNWVMFRWSGFFPYHQTGTIFDGINYRASTLGPEPH